MRRRRRVSVRTRRGSRPGCPAPSPYSTSRFPLPPDQQRGGYGDRPGSAAAVGFDQLLGAVLPPVTHDSGRFCYGLTSPTTIAKSQPSTTESRRASGTQRKCRYQVFLDPSLRQNRAIISTRALGEASAAKPARGTATAPTTALAMLVIAAKDTSFTPSTAGAHFREELRESRSHNECVNSRNGQ